MVLEPRHWHCHQASPQPFCTATDRTRCSRWHRPPRRHLPAIPQPHQSTAAGSNAPGVSFPFHPSPLAPLHSSPPCPLHIAPGRDVATTDNGERLLQPPRVTGDRYASIGKREMQQQPSHAAATLLLAGWLSRHLCYPRSHPPTYPALPLTLSSPPQPPPSSARTHGAMPAPAAPPLGGISAHISVSASPMVQRATQ